MFPFGQFWVQTSSHASAVAALAATLFRPNVNIHNLVLKGFWHAQNMVRVYTFEKKMLVQGCTFENLAAATAETWAKFYTELCTA